MRVQALLLSIFALGLAAVGVLQSQGEQNSVPETTLTPLVALLGNVDDVAIQRDVLEGIHTAVEGRRKLAMPANWPQVYAKLSKSDDARVKELATVLAILFGDEEAVTALRKTVTSSESPVAERTFALRALLQSNDASLLPIVRGLLDDEAMRGKRFGVWLSLGTNRRRIFCSCATKN